ncbi:MAG TPA: VWA domain-containing protein [Candidatus Acidoferrales bacterium]|jgi:VWFA-related protein|nr:VWA domain-containing protein [Candidatus Acidoferrales bacterium]
MIQKALALALAVLIVFSGFLQAPLSHSVAAQSAPSQPQSQKNPAPPAVRVTTRMVQVTVFVHDKDGNPISGLAKNDFVLFDQGQRQQIESFSEQTNRVTTANASPNLFTNRFAQGAAAQSPLTVIVVDVYNTRYRDLSGCIPFGRPPCAVPFIFKEVEKFISQMQPQDRVALYELADKLYLLQDFTSDPSALQRGLESGKEYVNGLTYPPSATFPLDMSNFTMNAMHAILDRLATMPGRKNLIWLSTGFSSQRILTNEKIDSTAKSLANGDLPLSAIDASGLGLGGVPIGPVPGGGGGGRRRPVDTGPPPPGIGNTGAYGGPPGGFNPIRNLSEASGGRAFYNSNDLAGSIRRVIDDSAATYLLGYYPGHNKWNGEFREIKVKVDRPGVEVRSRRGYYAVADSNSAPAANLDAEKLAQAIRSPLESTDLAFDVQADGVNVSGARQLKIKITLDANQLRFRQQGVRWTDSLTKVWVELDSDGRQIGTISKTISLNPTQDEYKQLLQNGYSSSETLALAPDAAEVRLVLRDAGNGSIGSVTIPLAKLFPPENSPIPVKK